MTWLFACALSTEPREGDSAGVHGELSVVLPPSPGDTACVPEAETCDGLDNDCDGAADSPVPADAPTWYFDADGDGAGNPMVSVLACDAPAGHVSTGHDCDDGHAEEAPGLPETCDDGFDNDCAGDGDAHCRLEGSLGARADAGVAWFGGEPSDQLGTGMARDGTLLSLAGVSRHVYYTAAAEDGGIIQDVELIVAPSEIGLGEFSTVANLGDLDGSGCDALFAGGERDGAEHGTAWIFDGCARGELGPLDAFVESDGRDTDRFGAAAAALDGALAVSASLDTPTTAHQGRVYVYDAPLDGLGAGVTLSLPDSAGEMVLGHELLDCELDGDGVADLAIGAPGYGAGAVMPAWAPGGAVIVAFGPVDHDLELVGSEGTPDPSVALIAGGVDAGVGEGLACGDLDGDGLLELWYAAMEATGDRGGIYAGGLSPGSTVVATEAALSVTAPALSGLATGRAYTGDVDGDGADDLLSSAYDTDAILFYGPLLGPLDDSDADATVAGASPTGLDDIDGDGLADLVLGDRYADEVANDGGAIFVLSGGNF